MNTDTYHYHLNRTHQDDINRSVQHRRLIKMASQRRHNSLRTIVSFLFAS